MKSGGEIRLDIRKYLDSKAEGSCASFEQSAQCETDVNAWAQISDCTRNMDGKDGSCLLPDTAPTIRQDTPSAKRLAYNAYDRLIQLARGEGEKAYGGKKEKSAAGQQADGEKDDKNGKKAGNRGIFVVLGPVDGSGIETSGDTLNLPGISGDKPLTNTDGWELGVRGGYDVADNWRLYAQLDTIKPPRQKGGRGGSYEADRIWRLLFGAAFLYPIAQSVRGGLAAEVGGFLPIIGSREIVIKAPFPGKLNYWFASLGPQVNARFGVFDLTAYYMYTPTIGDDFGQTTQEKDSLVLRTRLDASRYGLLGGFGF